MTALDRLAVTAATCLTALVVVFLLLTPPLDDGDRDLVGTPRPTRSATSPVFVPATVGPAVTFSVDPSSTEPSPTSTVETAPPAGLFCGGWGALIAEHFPADQVDRACEIADCESGFDPGAVSDSNDHGLFQLHAGNPRFPGGWQAAFERLTGELFFHAVYDPALNVEFAAWLHAQSGWQPWVCAR